jgi:DNA processing protein
VKDSPAAHDTDIRDWLALLHTPDLGPMRLHELLARFGTPRALLDPIQTPTDSSERLFIRPPDWRAVERDLDWAAQDGNLLLGLDDPRYPPLLKEIPDAPPVLYVQGDPRWLAHPQLALVGSRNPSPAGRENALSFAHFIAGAGLVVTSGLALGIDALCHEGALQANGATVAVTGTGLDRVYPARHRDLAARIIEQGALVSEFPIGTPPLAGNFPRRNRLISGMSLGTLVIEAALQSGSLITARLSSEQGREVFALPGSIHNPLARGCHQLIRQGAKLVETGKDILEELGPLLTHALNHCPGHTTESYSATTVPERQQHPLLQHLGDEPTSIDVLIERSGLTADRVSSMLSELEFSGVVSNSGGLYTRLHAKG